MDSANFDLPPRFVENPELLPPEYEEPDIIRLPPRPRCPHPAAPPPPPPDYGRIHLNNEVDAILADSSLSIEDKVCAMLLAIMSFMDQDLNKALEKLRNLQNKQGQLNDDQGKADNRQSIDLAAQEVDRISRKREQLFRTYISIVERYNATAQAALQQLGKA